MSRLSGYVGQIISIDLGSNRIEATPTKVYANRFLGGRGIALKIHWDEVPLGIGPFDPANRLVFMTGPLCSVPGFAGSRWQVSARSPFNNKYSYCNLGGSWGAQLKFAGYDGIVIYGCSEKPVYLVIDDGSVRLEAAEHLCGKGAINTREQLKAELGKSFRIVAIGVAGEQMVKNASLTAEMDSSGSGGMGAVMGSKNLKAIAVRGSRGVQVADKEDVRQLRKKVKMLGQPFQIWPTNLPQGGLKKEICYGCIKGCVRQTYTSADGKRGKYFCQSANFYEARARSYYGKVNEVSFFATKLCDDYGMDTYAIETMITWLDRCHQAGILTEPETGLPLSKIGSLEFIETLLRMVSLRQGFGDILARGTNEAAQAVGRGASEMITDYMKQTGEIEAYGPRQYLITGLLHAMEPRVPIQQLHAVSFVIVQWLRFQDGYDNRFLQKFTTPPEISTKTLLKVAKRFWGSEKAADFSTYEGKALAAAKIQNRQNAKESLILCDFIWPIFFSPNRDDNAGDPTIESKLCSAVTGMEVDEARLNRIGERIFNLQRAVLAREGHKGREYDAIEAHNYSVPLMESSMNPKCIVPGKNGAPFSRKGMVVDKDKFEQMKDEFYAIRGWDVSTGLQTKAKLEELGMSDVAETLKTGGLLA